VRVVEAGAGRPRHDREPSLDHVGIDDQELLDAVEALHHDLARRDQVVDQVTELDLVVLEEDPQLVGTQGAVLDEPAEVLVVVGDGRGERRQVAGEATEGTLGVDLAVEDGVAVADQVDGDVEVLLGHRDELVAAVEDRLEVLAGAVEGPAELRGDRAEVLPVDAADGLVEVGEQGVGLDRRRRAVPRDLGGVLEEGTLVALRLELDVLLAHG
jgi:hypothetical protein